MVFFFIHPWLVLVMVIVVDGGVGLQNRNLSLV